MWVIVYEWVCTEEFWIAQKRFFCFEKLQEWEQTQLVSTMQRIACMMDAENLDAAPMLEVGVLQEMIAPE